MANMKGESNMVEVSSLHPCSGGTFRREAGHSRDPTWIDKQPASCSHPICGFNFRLQSMIHPRVPVVLVLVWFWCCCLPVRPRAACSPAQESSTECKRAEKRSLFCRNMNSNLSLMIDREHLTRAEASIDPVLPNLNG